tara:strand:+ start:859 stop:1569 length:711 start_codon:yes stop_codon:yes gene_type:complete
MNCKNNYNKLLTDHNFYEKNNKWINPLEKNRLFNKFILFRNKSSTKFFLKNIFGIIYLTAIRKFNYFIIYNQDDNIIAKVNRLRFSNYFNIKLCNKSSKNDKNETILYGKRLKSIKCPSKYFIILPYKNLHLKYKNNLLKKLSNYPDYYIKKKNYNNKNIKLIINKIPNYNYKLKYYSLKFYNKKISFCSSKNYQLIYNNNIIFEFGKISDDIFNILCKNPLSIIQAFGLALVTFS